jgi:peptidoglycan LD-endopeptidase LytH
MTRIGWIILGLIVVAAALFASMLTFGGARRRAAVVTAVPPVAASAGLLDVPVAGVGRTQLRDNWGDPREVGARLHHGLDIPAPGGTRVIAAGAGTVEKLFTSVKGGLTLYERSADGAWEYYYAHLSGYAPGVHEGKPVRAGDLLAFVGDTGDAGPGNTHLHFGLTRMAPGERWWQGEDVDPYTHLAAGGSGR